jgi:hypothetical protein
MLWRLLGFTVWVEKIGFDARSVQCNLGTGRLETNPSPLIDAGPRVVVSLVVTLPETFLSVLTPRRVWLYKLLSLTDMM